MIDRARARQARLLGAAVPIEDCEPEAEVAMAVDHPNLVKVYDVGRDPETSLGYILMEYVPGGSLHDRLMARDVRKERIPDIRLKRPKISRRVRELLRKMTAPRVEQRFQHPSEIIDFLDRWAARERRRWWLIGGCLLAAVLAAYAVAAWLLLSDSDEAAVRRPVVEEEFSIPESVD